MARAKEKPGKDVLYGSDLSQVLDDVKHELGGAAELGKILAQNLKGGDGKNPYLQTRTLQSLLRMIEKVDGRGRIGEVLTDEALDEEISKDLIKLLVQMPQDQLDWTLAVVQDQRARLAARVAKAEALREAALRPLGNEPNAGVRPTSVA